jgi:hypothetical protein
MGKNRKERRLALEREAKTGEPYHVALEHVRREEQERLAGELSKAPVPWQEWVRRLNPGRLRKSDVHPLAGASRERDLIPGTPEYDDPKWDPYCESVGPGPKSTHHIGYDGAIEVVRVPLEGLPAGPDRHGGVIWRCDGATLDDSPRYPDGSNALRCASCGSWVRVRSRGNVTHTAFTVERSSAPPTKALTLNAVYNRIIHAGDGYEVLVRATDPELGPYTEVITVREADAEQQCASGWRKVTADEEEEAIGPFEDYGSSED